MDAADPRWPEVGQVILVQDWPNVTANRQPRTRKCEVIQVPAANGSGHLVVDSGGPYGVITYTPYGFSQHYTWKLTNTEEGVSDVR